MSGQYLFSQVSYINVSSGWLTKYFTVQENLNARASLLTLRVKCGGGLRGVSSPHGLSQGCVFILVLFSLSIAPNRPTVVRHDTVVLEVRGGTRRPATLSIKSGRPLW